MKFNSKFTTRSACSVVLMVKDKDIKIAHRHRAEWSQTQSCLSNGFVLLTKQTKCKI